MGHREQLLDLFQQQNGLVLTRDLEKAGIPRHYLTLLLRQGLIERANHGVYVTPEAFEDELYALQARNRHIIFSHETALYLHDLTDRDPISWTVTVPSGYNGQYLSEKGIQVYSIKKELHLLGVAEAETPFGRPIRIYNPERTLCDMVRNRSTMDSALTHDAMKRYLSSKDKNIPLLLRYAEQLRIASLIRQHVEILL